MSARPMKLHLYRSEPRSVVDHVQDDGTPVYTFVGTWRWRIRATNGRILADSGEAYGRLRDCAHGAGLVTGLHLAGIRAGDDWITSLPILSGESWRLWRIVVDA